MNLRLASVTLAVLAMASTTIAAERNAPSAVSAAISALGQQCARAGGQAGASTGLSIAADLNGDGFADWIVNEGALDCRGAAKLFGGAAGASITVFAGGPGGEARPAFNGYGYGIAIDGPSDRRTLWIKTSGVACGQRNARNRDDEITCDRPLAWNGEAKRFEFAPVFRARIPSRIY